MNETVIWTEAGDRYHVTAECRGLRAGVLAAGVQGKRVHTRHTTSEWEAAATGRGPCITCLPGSSNRVASGG